MSIIPITNIINVNIQNTPSGITETNVNSLALFTNETPNNLDQYRTYISAAQVAQDFGTASVTAAMANAIFAQSPNILSGDGQLVILPLIGAVSATSGKITTASISANLADIILVNNGDIRATIDGVAVNLLGLNFTNATTFADVAKILQVGLINGIVEATATGFKITSKKVGTASTVALAAVSGGTGVVLAGAGYFNAAAATAVGGANSSGETILSAIARTTENVGYTGVITNVFLEDGAITTIAAGIQAMDRLFLHQACSTADIAGLATTISTASQEKTRILTYTDGQVAANLMKAAYAGRAFSVNFSGSFTASTMNLKVLASVTPDKNINQTLYTQANTAGTDLYVSWGVAGVFSTGGNDFFDNPYMNLALKFALEAAGFNYLRQTNTKVPQTEAGMDGLKNAYAQVLERFIRNGSIAAGSWTSSETFGNPEIFRENILTRGYYIYSLPVVQQSSIEREAREAPLVQIAVKRAGAIHSSDVIVVVND